MAIIDTQEANPPMSSVDAPVSPRRLGFMIGHASIPDDFDRMAAEEIEQLCGKDITASSQT